MPEERSPHIVDVVVGAAIRQRRKSLGMSQEQLGQALGLTFQQIQKYERGSNRISASKLYEAATALGVSIAFFFRDVRPADTGSDPVGDDAAVTSFMHSNEGVQLSEAFPKISQPTLRRKLVDLVCSIAGDDPAI